MANKGKPLKDVKLSYTPKNTTTGRVAAIRKDGGYTPAASGRPPVPPRGGSAVRAAPAAQAQTKPKSK